MDVIASGAVPVIRLTEVFRQAARGRIVSNAHCINAGQMPELAAPGGSDFFFVEADEPEEARRPLAGMRDCVPAHFGLDAVRDMQLLCPMNRGNLGARTFNIESQRALNPPGPERVGWSFGLGDRVMQVASNYERDVFNGDLGLVATKHRRKVSRTADGALAPAAGDV